LPGSVFPQGARLNNGPLSSPDRVALDHVAIE
jgi:hypothetical protein